jgi:hypothetical protein
MGEDRVQIARVETRDIGAEAIAIGVRQFRLRPILGRAGQFTELRASAMQGCFYRGQAEIHHLANAMRNRRVSTDRRLATTEGFGHEETFARAPRHRIAAQVLQDS